MQLCYCQLKSTHRPHKDSRRKILCCREKGSSLQNRFSPPSTQLRTSSPRSVESQNRMQVQPRRSGSVILQINLSIFLRATSQALGPAQVRGPSGAANKPSVYHRYIFCLSLIETSPPHSLSQSIYQ